MELLAQSTTTELVTKQDGLDVYACVQDLNILCNFVLYLTFLDVIPECRHAAIAHGFSLKLLFSHRL